jgi:hypothetical protein
VGRAALKAFSAWALTYLEELLSSPFFESMHVKLQRQPKGADLDVHADLNESPKSNFPWIFANKSKPSTLANDLAQSLTVRGAWSFNTPIHQKLNVFASPSN